MSLRYYIKWTLLLIAVLSIIKQTYEILIDPFFLIISFLDCNSLFIFLAIAFSVFGFYIQALRWELFFDKPKNGFQSIIIMHFFNAILPFKPGEILRFVYFSKQNGISLYKTASVAVFDRLTDFFIVCILLCFILLGNYSFFENYAVLSYLSIFFFTFCVVIFFLIFFPNKGLTKIIEFLCDLEYVKKVSFLYGFFQSTLELNFFSKKAEFLFLTLILWLSNVLVFYCFLKIHPLLESNVSVLNAIILLVFSLLSYAFPALPGGAGIVSYGVFSALFLVIKIDDNNSGISTGTLHGISVLIFLISLLPELLSMVMLVVFRKIYLSSLIQLLKKN